MDRRRNPYTPNAGAKPPVLVGRENPRAMAELGPDAQLASRAADLLQRTSSECGPTRKQLIDKGLLHATEHGYAAFTVPGFDECLK